MLLVMALCLCGGGVEELQTDELEALLLKTLNDLTDEAALDSIGLDCDEGALLLSTSDAL